MDDYLYIAMSGAKQNFKTLALRGNNLANANTDGFKAEIAQARTLQVYGEGHASRAFAVTESPSADFTPGVLQTTGRNLDVAINGDGFFAVQGGNGDEAYTRNGSLRFDPTGMLTNSQGQPMLGDDGPIFLPLPIQKVDIGQDGTITVRPQGAPAEALEQVGRLKMVKPNVGDLYKGEDGLFRQKNGVAALPDATVRLQSGAIEGSNVNAVAEMVGLIDLQRQFEMQIKMMKTAEENDRSASSLMKIG
ncbi:flagellar basal-body rod protein FlgF [Paraferrimonas sedimenticola]|uniref:Flagellar basal-body rod protein FlgF n=1 Tax=Paraferrimonas sedimenticola TaxID=375674 RepID=A0AA37VSV6_9GAMM|nr:flagellar basal-body rod protein FlgF [Paraferrimonas sedimenticola]GLP94991.1 flagellar basal-body rod protein FlgF [Paraferrimonas sedimenticola]